MRVCVIVNPRAGRGTGLVVAGIARAPGRSLVVVRVQVSRQWPPNQVSPEVVITNALPDGEARC